MYTVSAIIRTCLQELPFWPTILKRYRDRRRWRRYSKTAIVSAHWTTGLATRRLEASRDCSVPAIGWNAQTTAEQSQQTTKPFSDCSFKCLAASHPRHRSSKNTTCDSETGLLLTFLLCCDPYTVYNEWLLPLTSQQLLMVAISSSCHVKRCPFARV